MSLTSYTSHPLRRRKLVFLLTLLLHSLLRRRTTGIQQFPLGRRGRAAAQGQSPLGVAVCLEANELTHSFVSLFSPLPLHSLDAQKNCTVIHVML
ncbi:hypothetical protein F5J12DRAFT_798517 [Pisolithus orientalis]|uniref:uncharacterized protein n=1 Tax=Pisolithus orientalis TaxID=936130 RepID=UPI0022249327|nr:uncharacterized protein F5J12DRAFT_798517 [Pisolithus orientalis]KAI6033063.1 hypothetical protein F5J12DRAFT_798517 [Pisolithus orientalis]